MTFNVKFLTFFSIMYSSFDRSDIFTVQP